MDSALLFLGTTKSPSGELARAPAAQAPETRQSSPHGPMDIRRLKELKKPGSANEMSALVAYYLAELASESEKKATIDVSDIEKYFKQAQFRLPKRMQMVAVNAKAAGYFDSAGGGQYKLNPVGYNLVVHSLPRGGSTERLQTSKRNNARKLPPQRGRETKARAASRS